uniref:Uncharacterized protein n=1 Tax=Rhizophora mucronata TaxID=61149 RepID=A0A2P2PMJ2_RHIMU
MGLCVCFGFVLALHHHHQLSYSSSFQMNLLLPIE